MRTQNAIAILILASSLNCRQTATEPVVERRGTPSPPPKITTPDLAGAWSGAITFGSDYRRPCAPTEGIAATLAQRDTAVSSSFWTRCEGTLQLQGTLSGTYLSVDLVREDGTSIGKLEGSVSATRIYLENRDGAPWDYGYPTIGLTLGR